jgi:hypothetical protein
MWYDQSRGIPEPGSALEAVFLLVFANRTRAEMLATHASLQAQLLALSHDAQDPVISAYKEYAAAVYPFVEQAEDIEGRRVREQLADFVKWKAKIDLRPIWKSKIQHARMREARRRVKPQPAFQAQPIQAQPFAPQERKQPKKQ